MAIDFLYYGAGISLVLLSLAGFLFVKQMTSSPKALRARLKDMEGLYEIKKKEAASWKAKHQRATSEIQVEGIDLAQEGGIGALIQAILPQVADKLPPEIVQALNDPKSITTILKLYEKHKDKLGPLLSKFIGKKGSDTGSDSKAGPDTEAV